MPHGFSSADFLGFSPARVGAIASGLMRLYVAAAKSVASLVRTFSANVPAASPRCAVESLEGRQLLSATYFVSTTGSDSNPGTLSKPFHTIQHAATVASAGSTIDIMSGVYHETVKPANSDLTFQAYNGANVEIDGADPVSGFTKYSGSIYEAKNVGSLGEGNNQVFQNGQMLTEARWPNSTSLSHPVLAHASKGSGDSVTDPAISSSGVDWVGGIIHISVGQQWTAQTATIYAQSGDTVYFHLGYNPPKAGGPEAGNAFYLTGKFQALTAPGEWFIDSSGNLFIDSPSGPPAGIEVKHREYGFNLSGKSNITINGINLFACSIIASGSSGIKINDVNDSYVSQFLITPDGWQPQSSGIMLNGNNNSVTNSVIAYSAGNGIVLYGHGNTASNNVVHDIDYEAYDASAILIWGSGDTVSHNTIYNCGRDGIKWSGTTSSQVTYNTIHDVMLQTTDGGAIYTYGTNGGGSVEAYNTVYNIHSGGWGSAGLYFDNNSSNYSIHNNDVFNVDIALKMNPTNYDERVIDNTLLGTMDSVGSSGSRNLSGSIFEDNVFDNTLMIGGAVKMIGNKG